MSTNNKRELSDVLKEVSWREIPYSIDTDAEDSLFDDSGEINRDTPPPPNVFIFGQKEKLIYKGPAQKWTPAEFMGGVIFYTNYPGGREVLDPQTKKISRIGELAQVRWDNILESDKLKKEVANITQNNDYSANDAEIVARNNRLFLAYELGKERGLKQEFKLIKEGREENTINITPAGVMYIRNIQDTMNYYMEVIRRK